MLLVVLMTTLGACSLVNDDDPDDPIDLSELE